MFYLGFLKKKFFFLNERISHFLFFGEQCEWIAHFAPIKWAMWANHSFCSPKMSDHERFAQVAQRKWANCSGRSPKMSEWVNRSFFWANRSFTHFWTKNKRFAWKSNERNPSPDSIEYYQASNALITLCSITFVFIKDSVFKGLDKQNCFSLHDTV